MKVVSLRKTEASEALGRQLALVHQGELRYETLRKYLEGHGMQLRRVVSPVNGCWRYELSVGAVLFDRFEVEAVNF